MYVKVVKSRGKTYYYYTESVWNKRKKKIDQRIIRNLTTEETRDYLKGKAEIEGKIRRGEPLEIIYLDKSDIVFIHDSILDDEDEEDARGFNYEATIDFIVYDVQNYKSTLSAPDSLFWKAAKYLKMLGEEQAFNNGNKRTALVSCDSFLRVNGYSLIASAEDVETLSLKVGRREISMREVKLWIEKSVKKIEV